jgi:hypothetical protein
MAGELIRFERHRDLKRGHLYRQQPVPRGPALGARNPSVVELQVARIARLLTELEELTATSDDVPAPTLGQARASIEKARRIIGPWAGSSACKMHDESEGDPQPEVDDERLERMYRELNREA